jgi:hypothetical protein
MFGGAFGNLKVIFNIIPDFRAYTVAFKHGSLESLI